MAYSWFRVDSSIADHPKTGDLEVALNDPNAGWYVIRLFCWTQQYATTGLIKYARADQIEAAMRWKGPRGALVEVLLAVGWLDDDSQGHFEVHDWDEIQGPLVEKSNNDAKAKKKKREDKKKGGAKTARAAHAPGARPAPLRTDETDGRNERTEKPLRAVPAEPKSTDPRHNPLLRTLVFAFEQARGEKYEPHGRDFKAISNLLGKHEPPAIESKWRKALRLTHPPVSNIFELDGPTWNRATDAAQSPQKPGAPIDPLTQGHRTEGPITAEEVQL
jgi:hypothetical protein